MEKSERAKMTDDRLERMKELFAACLEQPPQARSVFLDEACPTDLNLREEVSRLLAEYDEASDFLENPPLPVSVLRASWQGFVPGEIISNRYIILGLIAEGGMGRVYEAEDRELKIRVALKAIRSEIASGEQAIEHLKHEIYAARTVAHPNVCRIFDLGYHQIGPDSKIAFMTMELLSGETLSSFLKRTQRMTAQEALPIVEQMALGLDAAHKAGVIHRDFKSSNTILVPCDGKSLRVVITDFGLARVRVGSESVTALSSCSSQIFGTLDYMSPEQLRGERVGRATDLYALGIVMYEMVTGVRPFAADTPMAGALRRLEMKPQSPRKHIPSLDRRWEKTILRCLEASPHNRFASAQDVVQSLRGEIPLAHPGWQRWIMAAAIIGLFVLSLVGFRSYRRTQLGRKSQLAQVRFKEGLELQEKGQLEKAQAAFEEARRLYVAVGSRIDIVKVLDRTGDVFSQRGDWAQAKKSYEEALAVCREIGAEKPAASLLTGVGIVLHYQGDLAGARKSYEEALEIYRKINDRDGMAKVLKDLGNVAPTQTEAERYYEQALAVAREIGDRSGVGFALDDVGVILNIEGHLSAARKRLKRKHLFFVSYIT
jgi:tetratricopeptide (TPR) repeat protein